MTDYREQVALAARAVSVRTPPRYAWFGMARRPARASLPPALARTVLVEALTLELYESFYVRGRPVSRPPRHTSAPPDPSLLAALSGANTGRGGWEPGWQVVARDGAALTVRDRGITLRATAVECDDPSRAVVALRRPRESPTVAPGYVVLYGDAFDDGELEVRLYFAVGVAAAPTLVATLTRDLNSCRVPFTLKLPTDAPAYKRADAAVLYLGADGLERARPALRAAMDACHGALRDRAPAFTKPLARGLAVGEHHPADGISFGMTRCRLLSEGLVEAHDRGAHGLTSRVDAVARRFAEAGFDLDRPYLASPQRDDHAPL